MALEASEIKMYRCVFDRKSKYCELGLLYIVPVALSLAFLSVCLSFLNIAHEDKAPSSFLNFFNLDLAKNDPSYVDDYVEPASSFYSGKVRADGGIDMPCGLWLSAAVTNIVSPSIIITILLLKTQLTLQGHP